MLPFPDIDICFVYKTQLSTDEVTSPAIQRSVEDPRWKEQSALPVPVQSPPCISEAPHSLVKELNASSLRRELHGSCPDM